MTSALLDRRYPAERRAVVTQLSDCVEQLAVLAGAGCLVESASGRLLAHLLLGEVPELLASCVLAGDLAPLHQAMTGRRAAGLLPGGAVVEAGLPGTERRVAYLPLQAGGWRVGGLWLLPAADSGLVLDDLGGLVLRLASLLDCSTTDDSEPSLAAALDGQEGAVLPPGLASADRLWVARLDAGEGTAGEALQRACASGSGPAGVHVHVVRCGHRVYLVAGGSRRAGDQVLRTVQARVESGGQGLGRAIAAGVSDACGRDGLAVARQQADAAVREAAAGTSVALAAVRSRIVLRQVAEAVEALPVLGPDLLELLIAYDRRRGCDLVTTLQTWLDAFGDVPSVTTALAVHPNTLRYRLRRIKEITGIDLRNDAAGRLELQLRLRAHAFGNAEGAR